MRAEFSLAYWTIKIVGLNIAIVTKTHFFPAQKDEHKRINIAKLW